MNEIEKMRIDVLKSVTRKELDDGVIALDIDSTTDHLRSEGYSKQEWISVEERLPKICQYVLWSDGHSIVMDFRTTDGKLFEEVCYEPTHWMPLPEAPKGGAE